MGNNILGSTRISYYTKEKILIEYIYFDLKGKNRFPPVPQNQRQIELMFQKTLTNVEATEEQLELLKEFNHKYQFRFVILHARKVEEYKEKNELVRLRRTKQFDEDSFKSIEQQRKKELDDKLKLLEYNETAIKMHLSSIDRLISQKNAYTEFIKIDGIKRLISILDKAIHSNKQGTKTIFQNQIEILKFLKSLSDHNPKEYFSTVATIPNYSVILLRAYHPVNIAVTAYVLIMLQDYAWKVENSISLMESLKLFKEESNHASLLEPFAETIYNTDNILMCYYNLRFINEALISIVDDMEKSQFERELSMIRYELLIEDVKSKLQENYFKIDHCTFIHVSQTIYKHATKNKKETKETMHEALTSRATLNLQTLQQHLLVNLVVDHIDKQKSTFQQPIQQQPSDDDDDYYITVYLVENDRKSFNKFLLDTFSEIQHFYKYSIIVDEEEEDKQGGSISQEMEKMKKQGLSVEEYLKRIKGSCLKNGCEDTMLVCFKAFQYFQKGEWKKLQIFVNDGMKTQRNVNEISNFKRQIEERDQEVKMLKKQMYEFKSNVLSSSKLDISKIQDQSKSNKLDMSLFSLNNSTNGVPILPPPPPPPLTGLNPPPPLNGLNLPPPPKGIPNLPPPPSGIPILPPPPPPPTGLPKLPPPPNGIPILPPPPSLLTGLPNLPPPPNGFPSLPGLPPPPPLLTGKPSIPPAPTGLPGLPGLPSLPKLATLQVVQQKKKPKRQPKVNLKACNYMVLGYDKIVSTIWQKVDESKIKIDENELQKLFAKAIPKEKQKSQQSAINLSPIKPVKKEAVKLLGADRWRNLEIVLAKLKLPQKAVTEALTQCSGKYTVPTVLDSLNNILPTEEEQMMIKSYEGDDELGKPQQLIKELIGIPEYGNRIKALIFSNVKEEMYFELQSKIDNLTQAFESLKINYRLHYVLEVALAVGNYLNGNGLKGGAWGFRLDSLENMQEVTSSDNKMNAGFFVIKEVWKKYAYPIFDKEEVEMYQYISKMPTSQVKSQLAELKRYTIALDKAFKSKNKKNPNDRIDVHCEELLIEAKSKYTVLEEGVKKMDKVYTECATFYCEDINKGASDEIGKKIFQSILYIFNTQKLFYELQEKRKKQEARKAPKVEVKFTEQVQNVKQNPQANNKPPVPKFLQNAIKLPMPMSTPNKPTKPIAPEISAEQRLKELQKTQQQKQKKFLQEMMKKRSSKMMAFRQSKLPMNSNTKNSQIQIQFLKGV